MEYTLQNERLIRQYRYNVLTKDKKRATHIFEALPPKVSINQRRLVSYYLPKRVIEKHLFIYLGYFKRISVLELIQLVIANVFFNIFVWRRGNYTIFRIYLAIT